MAANESDPSSGEAAAAAGKLHVRASELLGWYGTSAIIVAYGLVSFKLVSSDGLIFQLLNLTGSLGLLLISYVKRVRQTIWLNIFWSLIGIAALARLLVAAL